MLYEDRSGQAAAQGTLFHEMAEFVYRHGIDPGSLAGVIGSRFLIDGHIIEFDRDMIDNMFSGIDWLREQHEDDMLVLIEDRVDLSQVTMEPHGFGTSDVIQAFRESLVINIFDWKYGLVGVSADDNEQMKIYALGAWFTELKEYFGEDIDPHDITVNLVVWQPRAPGGGGIWTTTMGALLDDELPVIREDGKRALTRPDIFVPGTEQCIFCSHRRNCAPFAEWNVESIGVKFEDIDYEDPEIDMPVVEDLTPEQKVFLLRHFDVYKRWIEDLGGKLMDDIRRGEDVPGMKIVKGRRGPRKWSPKRNLLVEKLLAQALGERAFEVQLISPTRAQELLGERDFLRIFGEAEPSADSGAKVLQSEAGVKLAPIVDARERVATPVELFDDLS